MTLRQAQGRMHRLPNGIAVAVESMAGVETCAVGLYADVGARSESEELNGLAHMVEHMVFKGAGSRDARAIAEDIEDVGGTLNAWTSRDQTTFHARLLAADLPLGLDIVADLVRAPHFDADELEREKSVVRAELGEAHDTPDDIIFDHLQGAAFPGQPLGRPVLGDEESIGRIEAASLGDWLTREYRPERLVIAAAGKVDEDTVLRLAEARFGDLAAGPAPVAAPGAFASGVHHDTRRFDQLHVALGFEGVGYLHDDAYALALFAGAVGGGASSRLFQEVREKRGLAYSIYAWNQNYAETGVLGVYLAAARTDGAKALALAREVLADAVQGMTEAELARAKLQAKAGMLMGAESVQARCDTLARGIQLYDRVVPMEESVAKFEAVTLAQLRAAAGRAIGGGAALATVGGKLAKAA